MNKNLNEDRPYGLGLRSDRRTRCPFTGAWVHKKINKTILNMTIKESKRKCGEKNTIDASIAELLQMGIKNV